MMKRNYMIILGLLILFSPANLFSENCGDVDNNNNTNILDITYLIAYLYKGGPAPEPMEFANVNNDPDVNLLDIIYLINYLYKGGPEPDCPVPYSTYDILFIGSSYFNFNNMPGILEGLIDSDNKTVNIHTAIQDGLYLADHASSATTELKINEMDWDFVFLQGVGRLVAYPDSFPADHPVYPALEILNNKILTNCASTKVVFCLPWAYEDGMAWAAGWTDEYEDMQKKIYDNTLVYSDSIGFIISPVGWAWNTVLEEQNYPLHYLHLSDWNHPSLKGSYLMARVIFSTIFQESTVGIDYSAGISEEEASYFQSVGSSIVLDSLELWKID